MSGTVELAADSAILNDAATEASLDTIKAAANEPTVYTVAVRALCEFSAKRGDLDSRFTPAPSAQEGIAGHTLVRDRRGSGYQSEISLKADYRGLHVRGRADGYEPQANRLEEIKTHRGRLEAMPERQRTLHWAQARVYAHMLCLARGLSSIEVALVYYDLAKQEETLITEAWTAADLDQFFEAQCSAFLAWAKQEAAHRQARDTALRALAFPLPRFRSGQRELSVAVYRTVRDGGCLMAQAPTGIGKTLGTLFPVLKACPDNALDKVFFLTAKASGRAMALDGVRKLQDHGLANLRTLELVAREKACEQPGRACHGDDCALARGFYDRLPAARRAAAEHTGCWDQAAVASIARSHAICPYYLSQELARWSDVVVGDYNYYYDTSALLQALAAVGSWRVAVLADEAHNLVERARAMYSATLDQAALRAVRAMAPKALAGPLGALGRQWSNWTAQNTEAYQRHDEIAPQWLNALQKAVSAITDHLAESPVHRDDALQRFYFDALHFLRLAEQFGGHSMFDVAVHASHQQRDSVLTLRNVVPAPFLAPRHASACATVMFSATLAPADFYRDTLGLPRQTAWLDVAAPFRAEQLAVRIVGNVSTRYPDRQGSVPRIVQEIAGRYAERPGNYLVFLSSFEYLNRVAEQIAAEFPEWPMWVQTPGMDEASRAGFLARFIHDGRGLGFAVLGGAFSEGVDLPGSRLVGVVIATLGLPQLNPVNEQMRAVMQERFGRGYDYTYLYPGLRKVVQAAGRVIRTESDEGSVTLIDDRYRRPEVRALLPQWWRLP